MTVPFLPVSQGNSDSWNGPSCPLLPLLSLALFVLGCHPVSLLQKCGGMLDIIAKKGLTQVEHKKNKETHNVRGWFQFHATFVFLKTVSLSVLLVMI
jgi:hypothetical protein